MQSPQEQKAIVQRMIDAGESEENIATVIQHFQKTTQPTTTPPTQSTARPEIPRAAGFATLGDLAIGAAKGAGSTVLGLTELINRGTEKIGLSKPVNPAAFQAAREQFTTPTNTAQSIGKTVEQIGEFVAPMGAVTKAAKALTTGSRVANVATRAGLEGLSAAAVNSAQTGSPDNATGVGATTVGLGLALPGAAAGLKMLGQRIETSLVKASARDYSDGFKIGNIYKHKLGGTLQQTYDKATKTLGDLGQQMKAELARPGPGGVLPEVDVLTAITDAASDFARTPTKTFGKNQQIQAVFDDLLADPMFQTAARTGKVDLASANEIKQAVGELGAWKYGMRDDDAVVKEMVANAIYSKLKTAIENAAVGGPESIKALNRQMGEIIPIRQAIIRRIPVNDRKNMVNLADMFSFSSGNIGLSIANRLLQSGRVANAAYQTGEGLGNANAVIPSLVGGGAQIIR